MTKHSYKKLKKYGGENNDSKITQFKRFYSESQK